MLQAHIDRPARFAQPSRSLAVAADQCCSYWVAALVPFASYLLTMPRTVYNIDSAELATAGATVGVPHPPGYPLYVLIAHAFTRLPIGDVGFRVNLMSAVFAAVALALVWAIVVRLTHSRLAGLFAAWLLGFAYPFWSDAIVAEVYTLDAALVAAMILCLLNWRAERKQRDLALAMLLFGLSLANRTTNALNFVPVALFLAPDALAHLRAIARAAPTALAGPALYLLLPLRSATGAGYVWGASYSVEAKHIEMDLTDPWRLWWFVSARVFRPQTEWYGWHGRVHETFEFTSDAWGALLGGGLIAALAGIAWLIMRERRAAVLIALIGAVQTAFFINYAAIDKDTMFVHSYVVFAIGGGCAIGLLARVLGARAALRRAMPAMLVLPLLMAAVNWPLLDVSDDARARDRSEAIFSSVERDSVVIGGWTDIAPLEYLQIVEGERDDVSLVLTWPISAEQLRTMIIYNLRQGRAVYALRRNLTLWNVELEDLVWEPRGDWYQLALPEQLAESAP